MRSWLEGREKREQFNLMAVCFTASGCIPVGIIFDYAAAVYSASAKVCWGLTAVARGRHMVAHRGEGAQWTCGAVCSWTSLSCRLVYGRRSDEVVRKCCPWGLWGL